MDGRGLNKTWWFRSYLTTLSNYTFLLSFLLKSHPLAVGVPQGSILGPVPFSIAHKWCIRKKNFLLLFCWQYPVLPATQVLKQGRNAPFTGLLEWGQISNSKCSNFLNINKSKTEVPSYLHGSSESPGHSLQRISPWFLAASSHKTNRSVLLILVQTKPHFPSADSERAILAFITTRLDWSGYNGLALLYLSELFLHHTPTRTFRFSVGGANNQTKVTRWQSLRSGHPSALEQPPLWHSSFHSLETFKSSLKAFFFHLAYYSA